MGNDGGVGRCLRWDKGWHMVGCKQDCHDLHGDISMVDINSLVFFSGRCFPGISVGLNAKVFAQSEIIKAIG